MAASRPSEFAPDRGKRLIGGNQHVHGGTTSALNGRPGRAEVVHDGTSTQRSPRSETDNPAPLKAGQSISTRIGEAL